MSDDVRDSQDYAPVRPARTVHSDPADSYPGYRVVGADRENRHVDETIVVKWFTMIADRLGRAIEGVTFQEYLRTFDEAKLTDRGLDAALRTVFNTQTKGFVWPSPEEICVLAREAEIRFRVEERPKLPPMDNEAQARATAKEEYQKDKAEAVAWAKANPDAYKIVLRRTRFDALSSFGKSKLDELTPFQADIYDAMLTASCLHAKAIQNIAADTSPERAWLRSTVLNAAEKLLSDAQDTPQQTEG